VENEPTAAEFTALAEKVAELGRICAKLSQENGALREQVASLSAGQAKLRVAGQASVLAPAGSGKPGRGDAGDARLLSRRTLGRSLGVAAAAAVGTGVLIDAGTRPAAAATGSNVVAGQTTVAEDGTTVTYDGASGFGGVVLLGNDSTYSTAGATYPAALGGWAGAGTTAGRGGVRSGVYGYTDNGAGYGVVGWNAYAVGTGGAGVMGRGSGTGWGVQGWSGTGRGVYGTTTGVGGGYGVYGTSASGTGVYGNTDSTAAGANAVHGVVSSASPGGFSVAVRGQNNGTGGLGIGVYGSQNGTGWGVYGTAAGGIGVLGNGGSGVGVRGIGTTGVYAQGSTTGLQASGAAAQVSLIPGTGATHPASGRAGDLYVDNAGRLWYCRTTGTTGWTRLD
jgi:hypothetical protein